MPLAVGVGISPVPIIAVILMLGTPRGRVNGPVFLLGWLVGAGIAGTIVLIIADSVGISTGDPSKAAYAFKTWKAWLAANNSAVMSVLFLVLAAVLVGKGIAGLT